MLYDSVHLCINLQEFSLLNDKDTQKIIKNLKNYAINLTIFADAPYKLNEKKFSSKFLKSRCKKLADI